MLLVFRGHHHSPFDFQFSFWDSRLSKPPPGPEGAPRQLSILFLRFWLLCPSRRRGDRSLSILFLRFPMTWSWATWRCLLTTFNSLFEIRRNMARKNIQNSEKAFNSLFEIPRIISSRDYPEIADLSILFLRFGKDRSRKVADANVEPFNSLFEIRHPAHPPQEAVGGRGLSILFLRFEKGL